MNAVPNLPASTNAALLSARLRQHTRTWHDSLDAHPVLRALTSDALTRPDYHAIVERLLGFYAPLEALLSRPAAQLPGFEAHERWKTPLLAHDLDVLRHSRAAHPPVPRCTDLPVVQTPSQALGVWYVAEGTALGGRAVLQNIRRTLGLSAGFGASFFACYQDASGRRWRAFLELLEDLHAQGCVDADLCVDAASDTLAALQRWFDAVPMVHAPRLRVLHNAFTTPLSRVR